MKLSILLSGLILIMIGSLAYMVTSNVHSLTIEQTHNLPTPSYFEVNSGSVSITPENLSIVPAESNLLKLNVTAYSESGNLSSLIFELAAQDNYQNCMSTHGPSCMVYRSITNDSITLPLRVSSVYYFVFDNTGSSIPKKCSLQMSLVSSTVESTASRDGSFNFAGLGLAVMGCLTALYGLARKTVIPWE